MTDEELKELRSLTWMPSRIPVLDALTTSAPKGGLPKGDIPQSYEQRWYPQQDDTVRLLIPYNGQEFDPKIFHIEPNAWDHTTCDHCNTRIPAMTLCYVTKNGSYIALCSDCFAKHVVNHRGFFTVLLWHAKRLVGIHAAA